MKDDEKPGKLYELPIETTTSDSKPVTRSRFVRASSVSGLEPDPQQEAGCYVGYGGERLRVSMTLEAVAAHLEIDLVRLEPVQ